MGAASHHYSSCITSLPPFPFLSNTPNFFLSFNFLLKLLSHKETHTHTHIDKHNSVSLLRHPAWLQTCCILEGLLCEFCQREKISNQYKLYKKMLIYSFTFANANYVFLMLIQVYFKPNHKHQEIELKSGG